jgi:ribosomal protein S4
MKIIKEQSKKRFRYYKMDFIFTLRKRINFRRKKRFKREFLLPRLLYNFYLILSRKNFMKFANIAKQKQGSYIENYLGLIEGRLFMMVYRSHLISNLFLIRYTIEYGIFCVNEKLRSHYNFILKPGDIL